MELKYGWSAMTHLKTLLAATAALATMTSFATAQTATQIVVRAYELSDSLWYTPDTSPACQRDREKCRRTEHRGRQTADDRCSTLIPKDDPRYRDDNDWCDASWVSTENTNLTQYDLQFDVTCTAFDRAVHVLGSGSTNKRGDEREGDDPGSAAREFNALPAAGFSRVRVRLPKVKYDDVAHVECHAINISRARDAIFRPPDSSCPQGWRASNNYCFRDPKE
jgi:hypothetical protein